MLALFDIDGTVVDTQTAEAFCFARAFLAVTGSPLPTTDWSKYASPTSSGIFRDAIGVVRFTEALELAMEARFVDELRSAREVYPGDFEAIAGVASFIRRLQTEEKIAVGFATGGFAREATFKLEGVGIRLQDFPFATSSDSPDRVAIIRLAASRAGVPLDRVVYFGDAHGMSRLRLSSAFP